MTRTAEPVKESGVQTGDSLPLNLGRGESLAGSEASKAKARQNSSRLA
jgi:hypothetical protein